MEQNEEIYENHRGDRESKNKIHPQIAEQTRIIIKLFIETVSMLENVDARKSDHYIVERLNLSKIDDFNQQNEGK